MRAAISLVVLVLLSSQASGSAASEIMVSEVEELALDGAGVIIAVADTGIDLDHSCFRDSIDEVGTPGEEHRKVVHINTSIDDWDHQGHQQFRHGTHIAGILACDPLDGGDEMRSLSNGSKLLVQDIVSSAGWVPPSVDVLLAESAQYGAVINSWSWGDNTINYTDRSRIIDEWTMENPWSLVFVAPGNGGTILEPANARNAVAVGATNSESDGEMWSSSSYGPDVNDRRGILISAPGMGVVSAKGDGVSASMNNESYSMTGTSMATPMAASFTALLQQHVVEREGFVPSAPLLRSMLALSADPVTGGDPDPVQGYGRPNLSNIGNGVWLHDSYATDDWMGLISSRGGTLESMKANTWNGSGSAGPFLAENETWSKTFHPVSGEDVVVVMSYNTRPMGMDIDDLRLIMKTPDGRYAVDDNMTSSGNSPLYYNQFTEALNSSTNETTVMIRVPAEQLESVEWFSLEVVAVSISGNDSNSVGLNGNRVGFGLAASGVRETVDNTAPEISVTGVPESNSNNTEEIEFSVNVVDENNDSFAIVVRLSNEEFSKDIGDCAGVFVGNGSVDCEIRFNRDLIPLPINRHDWRIVVISSDGNSSGWTSPANSSYESELFTIWWEAPLLSEPPDPPTIEEEGVSSSNRAILWGVFGIIMGALVAAGVLFRRFEKKYLDDVPPPFLQEE